MIRIQTVNFIPLVCLSLVLMVLSLAVCPQLFSFSNGSYENSERTDKTGASDPVIRYAGNHAFLTVSKISDHTFSVTLSPLESLHSSEPDLPKSEFVADYEKEQIWRSRTIMDPKRGSVGDYSIALLRSPLRVIFRHEDKEIPQELRWPDTDDGRLEIRVEEKIYGLMRSDQNGNGVLKTISNETDSHESRYSPQEGDPLILHSEGGWTLFIAHPASSSNSFKLDGNNGTFLPDSERLTSPVQIYITFWDNPNELKEEYSLFATPALIQLLQTSGIY